MGPPSPSITSRHLFSVLFSIGLQSGDLARSPGLIQRILQRACAGACANLGQRRIQTLINSMLIGDRSREWTYHLLNTSFIVMLIKRKTWSDMQYMKDMKQ